MGYVNLLPVQNKKSLAPGDSKEMVAMRRDFLAAGFYQQLASNLADSIEIVITNSCANNPFVVLDAGCGEGYYLDQVLERLESLPNDDRELQAIGVDISKFAIQAACKKRKSGLRWLVASNSQLPLAEQSVDLIVCAFGFACFEMFKKVLKPGGHLIMLDPGPEHLIEMRKVIYSNIKPFREPDCESALNAGFTIANTERWQCQVDNVSQAYLEKLLGMTPHLHRAPRSGIEAVKSRSSLNLTVDVHVRKFVLSS
ncbi:23S rRNA (guanine(745)-N(1))-methyltransferase [Corallincola platygyrae]